MMKGHRMPLPVTALLFLLLLFPALDAYAAGKWTTLTNPDYINMVVQEGDTLWCATEGGIVRFDMCTATFRVFTRDDGLTGHRISRVYIGRNGTKWFNDSALLHQEGDLWKYLYPADADTFFNGSWIHVEACTPSGLMLVKGQKWHDDVRNSYEFACFDGEKWAACPIVYNDAGTSAANPDDYWYLPSSSHSVARFNGKSVVCYSTTESPAGKVNAVVKDHDNVVWLISDKGIVSYDCAEWKTYADIPELDNQTLGSILYVDHNNVKWFKTSGGFLTFDGMTWRTVAMPESYAESVYGDRAGNLWVGTRAGLYKYDGATWTKFEHIPQIAAGSRAHGMKIIGEDSRGRIWFDYDTTFYPGLYSCDGTGITGHSLRTGPSYNQVTCITVDQNNRKWFGFTSTAYLCASCNIAGGISAFDGHTWKQYSTDDGLYNNRIKSLAVDLDGVLWAGTDFSHICWFDGETWRVNHDAYVIPDGMYSIAVDTNNVKWFTAPVHGIMRYDGMEWKLLNKASGIPDINVRSLTVDRDNILWAGATGGIWSYDGSVFTSYTMANGLPDSLIACAAVDSSNVKWFGSQKPSGGLISFDGKIFQQYTTADGLIGNVITAITVDKNNIKWVGTNAGVSRFDGMTFTNYSTADGLTSNNISSIAVDHDGIVWIGTTDGISRFEPDNLTTVEGRNAKPTALSITGNRPNPFNPSTTISFTLPAPGKATLTVYDVTGRKVRTLVSGNLPAGAHSAVWDGKDERGKMVSSGVYLSRLESGKATHTVKMLLMK